MKARDIFTKVLSKVPNTNTFDLSHDHKSSINFGELVPMLCMEALPGDYFKIKSHMMLRLAPLVAPIMHSIDVYTHYWYVPNRILWDNWEKFITGGETGEDEPVFPTYPLRMVKDDINQSSINQRLADYLGIPLQDPEITSAGVPVEVNAFPFAAYQAIWAEWYRDQNMIPLGDEDDFYKLDDGTQIEEGTFQLWQMRRRAWEHDYFTACLPWAQRGESVALPSPTNLVTDNVVVDFNVVRRSDGAFSAAKTFSELEMANGQVIAPGTPDPPRGLRPGQIPVSESTLGQRTTISELRTAIKLQEYLEKNARSGARYVEWLKSIFGVTASDSRLQRPEYIGGGKQKIVISEVLQTSETTSESPQGNYAGHGFATGATKTARKYCEEHGTILGIVSIRPRSSYAQMTDRFWWKNNKFDFYTPQFAHIGEQEVFNKEVQLNKDYATWGNQTFGYIPRYSEYRFAQSKVTGEMRNQLDWWNLSRKFSYKPEERPALNREFIEMNPDDFNRVFSDMNNDYDKVYIHTFFNVIVKRRVSKFGTPHL